MNNNDGGESLLRKDIIQFVNEHLTEIRQEDEFEKFLSSLFTDYIAFLDEHNNEIKKTIKGWNAIKKNIVLLCEQIEDALQKYLNGDMIEAYNVVREIMSENSKTPMQIVDCKKIQDTWYRMRKRKPGQRLFTSVEMSYPPFSERYKVDTHRYSILGYPCLYLSASKLCGWYEMNRPTDKCFAVSSFHVKKENTIILLNFTLPQEKGETRSNGELLMILPLIMACSIKVKHIDKPFKPEYVIPQLAMLAVKKEGKVMTKHGIRQIDGCIFTSTKRDFDFDVTDEYWFNIALPAKKTADDDSDINNLFTISNPTCYTYSIILKEDELKETT